MLKHAALPTQSQAIFQPPSGGCVLKPDLKFAASKNRAQPPSGGCVLKLQQINNALLLINPSRLRAAVC